MHKFANMRRASARVVPAWLGHQVTSSFPARRNTDASEELVCQDDGDELAVEKSKRP